MAVFIPILPGVVMRRRRATARAAPPREARAIAGHVVFTNVAIVIRPSRISGRTDALRSYPGPPPP